MRDSVSPLLEEDSAAAQREEKKRTAQAAYEAESSAEYMAETDELALPQRTQNMERGNTKGEIEDHVVKKVEMIDEKRRGHR